MGYRGRRTLVVLDSVPHWTNTRMQLPEVTELIPGRDRIGKYQSQNSRKGGRYFELNGVDFELGGQSAAATEPIWSPILKSAGMQSAAVGNGFSYTLADPHLTTETPSGNVTPIAAVDYYLDTQRWRGENCVSNLMFNFEASRRPTVTADFRGNIYTGTLDTASSRSTQSMPASPASSQPQSAPWQGSTVLLDASPLDVVLRRFYFTLGNIIPVRSRAGSTFGIAQFWPTDRAPKGILSMELPAAAVLDLEAKLLSEASMSLSFTYIAAGGVGTYSTLTVAIDFRVMGGLTITEDNGMAKIDAAFEQNPDGQAFKITTSQT